MDINYYKQYEPIFGAWRIKRLIGEGSFGKVFEIVREDFGVTYRAALKAITVPASEAELLDVKADGLDDRSVRAYFGGFVEELVKEFALMSRLKGNSNIVSYENHQVIEHRNGIGWDILIQMELLTPLNRYTAEQAFTQQDVVRLGADLCRALELCQTYHIIHRDVKPENIFISETGNFKLGDFGIARTVEKTTSGLSKKGTYTYMAPEVYKGEPYGATVDIYSLGIVLYRLLNGSRTPFLPAAPAPITHNDRENALARRLSGAPLPPPRFAQGNLAEIVLKACAYDPKDRYQNPAQMREDLESLIARGGENPILERGEGFTERSFASSLTPDAQPPAERTQKDPPQGRKEEAIPAPGMDKTVSDFADRRCPPQDGAASTSPIPETDKTISDFADRRPPQNGENPPVSQSVQKNTFPVWLIVLLSSVGVVLFAAFGLLVSSIGNTLTANPTSQAGTAASALSASQETADALHDVPATIEIGNYLETVSDDEGRVIERPNFEYDGSVSREIIVYGEDGKVRYTATYNLLGELESYTLRTYEETQMRSDSFNRFGELEGSDITYLENGRSTRMDYLDQNGDLINYRLYRRSDDGKTETNISYDADGSFSYATNYEYEDGVLWKQCELDENGVLLSYSQYERDENGRMLSHTIYDTNDRALSRTEFDSLSRTVKELTYGDSGEIERQNEYFYSDGGFRIRLEQSAGDGSLQTYTEYQYWENGKQSSLRRYRANGIPEYEATKDDWGNILSSVYYDDDGSITTKNECVYDEKGHLVTETSYGSDNLITSVREYNEDGLTAKYAWYSEGALSYTEETEYDENGETIKSSIFEPNGSLRSYTLFTRDDSGKLTQKSEYRSDDTLSRTIDYNEEGLTAKSTSYDEEGEMTNWTEYSYDENGNQIEIVHCFTDSSRNFRETWERKENGDPIRQSEYDENNVLSSYTEYTYNEAGDRTKMSDYSGDGTLKGFYVYEYDDQGNNIKTSSYDQNETLLWYEISEYDEEGSFLNVTTYDADGTPW